MPIDLEKIANIFGQETIKKVYEDGASQPVKESGKAVTDFVKAFRLFLAPVQLLGAWQDRLEKYLEQVRNNVKEENQIAAPAAISGPVIEQLKYQEEGNPLTELYVNLLSRAIDKEIFQVGIDFRRLFREACFQLLFLNIGQSIKKQQTQPRQTPALSFLVGKK